MASGSRLRSRCPDRRSRRARTGSGSRSLSTTAISRKLYAVPEPTTLAARQSKQVSFLSQSRVPFTRLYMFKVDEDSIMKENDLVPRPATTLLRLQNKESDGLGKPLPRGVISVMEPGNAGIALAGQDRIDDTPVGLPIELTLGRAMDVWIEPRVTEEQTIEGDGHDEQRRRVPHSSRVPLAHAEGR